MVPFAWIIEQSFRVIVISIKYSKRLQCCVLYWFRHRNIMPIYDNWQVNSNDHCSTYRKRWLSPTNSNFKTPIVYCYYETVVFLSKKKLLTGLLLLLEFTHCLRPPASTSGPRGSRDATSLLVAHRRFVVGVSHIHLIVNHKRVTMKYDDYYSLVT